MAIDSDNGISLPTPPPPRPAARKDAIEAALRKFDGVEEADARPAARKLGWVRMDRRAVGALATAAIIAVVSVPLALDALRDLPQPEAQRPPADVVAPAPEVSDVPAADTSAKEPVETAVPQDGEVSPPQSETRKVEPKPQRMALVANEQKVLSEEAAPAMARAAPPPPAPPPPPPPAPERSPQDAADVAQQDMVVTGSRIRRPEIAAESAAPLKAIDIYGDFLARLQSALRSDNPRAVSGLVGFPLSVGKDGQVETYRSRREVERDFDEIFTARVKSELLDQRPYSLRTRDDGRTKGSSRLWFAPACFNAQCSPPGPVRIREVNP